MRKITIFVVALLLTGALSGCGGKDAGNTESSYGEALDVMQAVFDAYEEADRFAIYGGNQENAVMDAPGKFDVAKTEELVYTLGLPEGQVSAIDDAASMVHMMNANMFTGAVYHLTDGTDLSGFADAVKTEVLNKQWVCGQPDTLLIIDAGGSYVVTAYGEAGIMEKFKANALSALEGAEVIVEAPIA